MRWLKKGISNNLIEIFVSGLNKTRKLLTIVAITALLWAYVPWNEIKAALIDEEPTSIIMDENNQRDNIFENYPSTTDPDFDPSEVDIDSEVLGARTDTTKTFKKIDGTYEVVIYNDVIHYYENGEYKQVDNSLYDNGSNEFENPFNKFKVKFPKKLDDNKQIKLELDKYRIDWNILNINSSNIEFDDTEANPKNIKDLIDINQLITYQNIQTNVDIEYILTGSKVKENIILNRYVQDFSLSFEYKVKDLELITDELGNILFLNEDNVVVFSFDSLYMIDNNLSESSDITFDYVKTGNKEYTITITPSDVWLKNAVYPVKIDPTIVYNGSSEIINDKFVYGSNEYSNANYNLVGVDSTYKYRSYLEINLSMIPEDSQITFAHLIMQMYGSTNGCTNDCTIIAKEVFENVSFSSITEQELEITEDRIIDYEIINSEDGSGKDYYWDISRNFQKWIYNKDTSRIIEFSKNDEITTGYIYFESTDYSTITDPSLEVGYQSVSGVKDFWTYNQQPVGTAGTGFVSDYTGQLNFTRTDLDYSTELQSLGLSFIYNLNGRDLDFGYGQGWRTNYNLEAQYDGVAEQWYTIDASGGKVYYVFDNKVGESIFSSCDDRFSDLTDTACLIAEDGSRNILVLKYEDHGYGLEVSDKYLVTLEQVYFHFSDSGLLTKIRNEKADTELNITYNSITYKRIGTITDSTGNYIELDYDGGDYLKFVYLYVKTSSAPDYNLLLKTEYLYDTTSNPGNRLLDVVNYYADFDNNESFTNDYSSTYVFDTDDKLTEAESSFGNKVVYTYLQNDRVETISSFYDNTEYGNVTYEYDYRKTIITNHLDKEVYYLFDVYGHTIQVMNENGLLQSFKYMNIFSDSYYNISYEDAFYIYRNFRLNHKLIYKSDPEISFLDPLLNGGFEGSAAADKWDFEIDDMGGSTDVGLASHSYTTSEFVFGEKSAKLLYYDNSMESHLEQTITLKPGTYKLQGYIKNEGSSDYAYFRIEGMSSNGGNSSMVPDDEEWHYVELTFDVSSLNPNIVIKLMNAANGSVYFDSIQIVEGFRNTRNNLFNNSSFESALIGWTTLGAYKTTYTTPTQDIYGDILGNSGIRVDGDEYVLHSAKKDITSIVGTAEDDLYTFNLWGYSEGSPFKKNTNGQESYFRARVRYLDSSNNDVYESTYILFDQQVEGWQKLATTIQIPKNTVKVELSLEYIGLGYVIFDGLTIEKESSGTRYNLNTAGNIAQIKSGDSSVTNLNHLEDENGKPISSTPINVNTVRNNTVIPLNDDFLPEFYENNNVRLTPTYDSNGRSTLVKYGDAVNFFTTSIDFDTGTFGQYKGETINEFGKSTEYDYDVVTGLLQSIRSSNGSTVEYEYYDDGLLHKVMNNDYCDEDDPTECAYTEYVYDTENRLSQIIMESGNFYLIDYDSEGRMEEVFVVNDKNTSTETDDYVNSLMSYTYSQKGINDEYETNLIKEQSYGNGDLIKFIYDEDDNVKEVQYNNSIGVAETRFSYEYDQRGQIAVYNTHNSSGIIETEYYDYDISGKLLSVVDNEGNMIKYMYDEDGLLNRLEFDILGKIQIVNYDNNEELELYRDILDEQKFSNFDIETSGTQIGEIYPSDSDHNYDLGTSTIKINAANSDPSFGGIIEVMPSSSYVLDMNLVSTTNDVRLNVFEYSKVPINSGNYVAGSYVTHNYSYYTTTTGNRNISFTTSSTTEYIIISVSSDGVAEFEFNSLELDFDGLDETSLHNQTTYITQDSQSVVRDYEYEDNALLRLDYINLQNGTFSIDQDYIYSGNTSRINEVEYRIDSDDNGTTDETIEYKYYYDNHGNIIKTYTYIDGILTTYEYYDYDEMNQLILEDHKDYLVSSCITVSDTCFTKIYKYDLRGNITDIKIYPFEEREIIDPVIPYFIHNNNGSNNATMFYNGSNEYTDIYNISIGQTPSLSFSFEQEGCSGCLIFGMNETLDYTNLNKNVEGYYYQQYTATDRFGRYDLVYRVVIKVGNPLPGVNYPSEHIKYNYSDDWLDQLSNYETLTYNADGTTNTQSTVQSYTYDNQGNPTEITNFIYNDTEYHHAELNYDGRQLNEINIYTSSQSMTYTISYTYNDQGYRTSKTVDGLTTVYHLQGDKVLLESSNEYDIIYTYDYDGKLISFYYESDSNGINDGEYFYIRNQQDDITKIVNENGTIVVEYMYDAWGNLLEIKGSLKDSIGIDNPYRYRGYRYDEEISMYYLNSRFYDANIGRFINSDGLMGQQGNILGHNMYAYTQNNPVMYVDPSGMSPETNGIISLVYKEAYKSPSANFYLFDYGGIDYKTKGRLLSNQTTIIELYALTTFSGFGAPFMTTSVGGRVNFDKLSLYSSISLTSVNYGFATESGYGSFSVGMVGQTIFDVGVGITFEANNQYINIKAPLSLILVVSLSPAAAFVTATAAVVITMVELMNKEGE